MKKSGIPVDRGWAWMVMIGCFVNVLVTLSFIRSLAILFPVFLQKYRQSAAITTLAFGIGEIMESTANILISLVLLPRFPVRTLCFVGALLHSGCIMVLAFTSNIILLNIFFGCIGFARGLMLNPQVYILGCYFKQRLSFANACANMGISVATLLSPLATRLLLDAYDLQWTFLIFGAYSLHSVLASLLFRPTSMYQKDVDSGVMEETETYILESFMHKTDHTQYETDLNFRGKHHLSNGNSEDTNHHEICYQNVSEIKKMSNSIEAMPEINEDKDGSIFSNKDQRTDTRELSDVIDYTEITPIKDNSDDSTQCTKSNPMIEWFQSKFKSICNNPVALLLVLATGVGVHTQAGNVYLPVLGLENGLNDDQLPWLLTITGSTDIAGKLLIGLLADKGCLHPLFIVCLTQTVPGISFQLAPLFHGMGAMATLCVLFGSMAGIMHVLLPTLVVRLIGLSHLPHVISGYYLLNCIMTFTMHVVVGTIKDSTDSFVGGFRFVGSLFLASVLLLLLVLPASKRARKQRVSEEHDNEEEFEKETEKCG